MDVSQTPLWIMIGYMFVLLGLGVLAGRRFTGTAADYFVASRSIGPFLLLMSVFGTTMTAFALIGSSGKAYQDGIGTYGKMASWSGLIHSACFFLIGIKLWAAGKRHGFVTQCQYFRSRFESNTLGWVMFPVLVGLVIPYLLIGLLGAGTVVQVLTAGMFPEAFPDPRPPFDGGVPPWLTNLVICSVVLTYVFFGGLRGAAWANTMQTIVFMIAGIAAMVLIANALGGAAAASAATLEASPAHLARAGEWMKWVAVEGARPPRNEQITGEGELIGHLQFLSYMFIPLSVGMFPHLFQHWLTAKSARTFRLTVIAHPICIMIVWVPCILIGVWAVGDPRITLTADQANGVISRVVMTTVENPVLTGLLGIGILAAIMSSLDSQFMCLGTMFTNDVVLHTAGRQRFSDRQIVWLSRGFVVAIVAVTYILSLQEPRGVFKLGVWCFTGFGALCSLAFASIYWKRTTAAGAIACVLAVAGSWSYFFFYVAEVGSNEGLGWTAFGLAPNGTGIMPVFFIFMAGLIALVAVSLMTKPPSAHTLAMFFPREADQLVDAPAEAPNKPGVA